MILGIILNEGRSTRLPAKDGISKIMACVEAVSQAVSEKDCDLLCGTVGFNGFWNLLVKGFNRGAYLGYERCDLTSGSLNLELGEKALIITLNSQREPIISARCCRRFNKDQYYFLCDSNTTCLRSPP